MVKVLKDEEIVWLIISEMEVYLSFDSMQREYAEKGIRNALKKKKRVFPKVWRLGEHSYKVLTKLYMSLF